MLRTLSGSPRLPDLRMVIVMDSRQPGMLHVDDVVQAGESRHQKELSKLQGKLSSDDPINIQFTSVTGGTPSGNGRRQKSGAAGTSLCLLCSTVPGDDGEPEGGHFVPSQHCQQCLLLWFEDWI